LIGACASQQSPGLQIISCLVLANASSLLALSFAPHLSRTFKLSSDPLFVDKARDIVGLYLSPPNRALVLCIVRPAPPTSPAVGVSSSVIA
jgi:hypothetical protein